ncbi:MAG: glycosyltransferase family 4 protein [Methylococcaceae bacterium]|nr:glycosyltransferase family 4 protein [Methylococcaceae bacterium]
MQKKILAFTNLFPRDWEPNRATFNRQQFQKIAEDFKVEVIVPVAWTDMLIAWKNKKLSLSSKDWGGVRATYIPYFFIPRFARWSYGFTMLLSSVFIVSKLIGSERPDVIFATWVYPDAFAAVCLGRLFNIPVVVKVHGSDINEQPKLTGVAMQVSWVLRQASKIVSVSKDLAIKVIDLGAENKQVKVIYNGVDSSVFFPRNQQECRETLSLNKDVKIILYVGNLKKSKGCLELLKAFSIYNQEKNPTELVFVGDGPCKEAIQNQIKGLELDDSIHAVGQKKHELLPIWMGAADLIVLPSHAEGVPNVLLEAMACGRPVVATTVGGIPEVVPDKCGVLVAPHDAILLHKAINDALQQKWVFDEIVRHASQFSWEQNKKSLSTTFLNLIK